MTEDVRKRLVSEILEKKFLKVLSDFILDSGFLLKLGAAVIALTFIAAGNQFPKLRRNSLTGARTKYSLSSDEAWHKTQRYAGRVMLCAGAALLLITLIPMVSGAAAIAAALAAMALSCIAVAAYKG